MTCINVTSQVAMERTYSHLLLMSSGASSWLCEGGGSDYGWPVDTKQPVLGSVIVEQLTTSNADRQRVCGWALMDYAMMIDYG